MNKYSFFIISGILLMGAFLISGGITGMVVSQSCCFPPNCAAENLCVASLGSSTISHDSALLYVFVFAAIGGLLVYNMVNRA